MQQKYCAKHVTTELCAIFSVMWIIYYVNYLPADERAASDGYTSTVSHSVRLWEQISSQLCLFGKQSYLYLTVNYKPSIHKAIHIYVTVVSYATDLLMLTSFLIHNILYKGIGTKVLCDINLIDRQWL
jgi:hypothetical protein